MRRGYVGGTWVGWGGSCKLGGVGAGFAQSCALRHHLNSARGSCDATPLHCLMPVFCCCVFSNRIRFSHIDVLGSFLLGSSLSVTFVSTSSVRPLCHLRLITLPCPMGSFRDRDVGYQCELCDLGLYCVYPGLALPCPAGRYGISLSQTSPNCSGKVTMSWGGVCGGGRVCVV
jgi:hypothetical protein